MPGAAETKRNAFIQGVKAELPILIGVIPFGMIYGVLALGAGLTPIQAQAMSSIVFAGSSQIVMAQMFASQSPGLIIVITVLVVNLRHALYSATMAPYTQPLSRRWKWLLAYVLTDEAFAVTILHYLQPNPVRWRRYFFLGSGLTLWAGWQISTAMGVFLGAVIPSGWSLDFALALTFIALVVPALKDHAGIGAALAAAMTAIIAYSLPYKLGLLLAAFVGVVMGLLLEKNQ